MEDLLKNNSPQMKTAVQTFIVEETESLIYDNENLDKWNDLISSLDLKGQNTIVKPKKSPIPFLHLKPTWENTLNTLCPRKVLVEDYDVSPIPLEILELIGLSKKENYFNKIEVWYDDKDPDPAVIGYKGYWYEPTWYSDSNESIKNQEFDSKQEAIDAGAKHANFSIKAKYLIGKWGDVKHSFGELKKMARERFIIEETNRYKKDIKETQRKLDDVESDAIEKFGI